MSKRPDTVGDLAHLLNESGMQVTVTGWKAELTRAEAEITRLQKLLKVADYIIVNAHTPLAKRLLWEEANGRPVKMPRRIFWHCRECGVEVEKGSRCGYCGKTKREKA